MKTLRGTIRPLAMAFLWMSVVTIGHKAQAQCNNNTYAISYTGILYQVDTTTLGLTAISGTAPGADFSNALAYRGSTNTFYFFSNSGLDGTSPTFYSYLPVGVPPAGVFTALSMVGGPTGAINTGCISSTGQGYYCLTSNGYIYYYKFSSGNWTTIATVIKDQWGSNITATMAAYSSGDMAFDGNGNLFLLVGNSSNNTYGLYRVPSAVPTSNVGTLTIEQIIAPGASLPDASVPVGISFTPSGTMFISTLANDLYAWRDAKSTPVLKGVLSQPIFDLSSCSLPVAPLPVHFISFTANADSKGNVQLVWDVADQVNTNTYTVEHSLDGIHWLSIGVINSNVMQQSFTYTFTDAHPANGTNFYRIKETDVTGEFYYSTIKKVEAKNEVVHIWPNPAKDALHIENNGSAILSVSIYSVSGKLTKQLVIHPGTNTININDLPAATYIVQIGQQNVPNSYILIKQ
jgi:hypothetical protein